MADSDEHDQFHHLVKRMDAGSTLLRTWQLTGGVSAHVTGLEVQRRDTQIYKLLVRRHGEVDLARNPHIARDEFKLLQIAQSRGLAVPSPCYLDETREIFPTPYLVVEYAKGTTEIAPLDTADRGARMASELARIHGVTDDEELSFLPRQGRGFDERPPHLDETLSETRIRDALESAWPLRSMNQSVLLHGDYWPGNILWRDGDLVAVIDWEDASVGDPLADVGNTRLEILWASGINAMQNFTNQYESMSTIDWTNLPYWDLCAALRPCSKLSGWGLDESTEKSLRERHRAFIIRAFERLSVDFPHQN